MWDTETVGIREDREVRIIASIYRHRSLPSATDVLALVETSLDDDQAESPTVIPLAGKADFADYMVIASGSSARKVGAMAGHIVEKLKKAGLPEVRTEGRANCDWVLIDAGDVVVHLFRPEVREYYAIEKLWETGSAAMAESRLVTA